MQPLSDVGIQPTKLFPPRRRPTLVDRPRLVDRIQQGLWRPLTVVMAPAGSGKTTLVSQWLTSTDRPVAWLSLEEADDEPVRFLACLLAAIRPLLPEVGEGLDGLGPNVALEDLTALLTQTLLVPLALAESPLVLVLDDAHLLRSEVVLAALDWLVDRLPPTVHLVLTTREEPALSLARRRARDEVTEILRSDLEFDAGESGRFLQQAFQLDLDSTLVERVRARTEGWAAGLQLAGLSLARHGDVEQVLASLGHGDHVGDYLVTEILDQLEPPLRDFLLTVSVLDLLEEPVCVEISGRPDSLALLRELDRRSLFVVPLDPGRRSFRLHALFADLLRGRLEQTTPGRTAELHQRAARWFLECGQAHRSVAHARAAGRTDLVAEVVDRWGIALLSRSERDSLEGWLLGLPEGCFDEVPGVALIDAWLAVLPLRVPPDRARALRRVAQARACLADDDGASHREHFPSHLLAVEALATRPAEPLAADQHVQTALADPSLAAPGPRSVLELFSGVVRSMGGRPSTALEPLERAWTAGQAGGNLYAAVAAQGYRAACLLALGRLAEAEAVCRDGLATAEREGCAVLGLTAYVYGRLGMVHLLRGESPQALDALEKGLIRARLMGDPVVQVDLLLGLARAHQHSGEAGLADEGLAEASALALRCELPLVLERVRADRRLIAGPWERREENGLPELAAYRAVRHGAFLADVRSAPARPGLVLLVQGLRAVAEQDGRVLHALDWALESVVLQIQAGEVEAATKKLQGLLDRCAEERIQSPFAERASELAPALVGLSASARRGLPAALHRAQPATVRTVAPDLPPLAELPSPRELEVLALIAEGLSNPEIARKLFVSTGTVKTHVHRLLGKLGARNRLEAVRTATVRGLLLES